MEYVVVGVDDVTYILFNLVVFLFDVMRHVTVKKLYLYALSFGNLWCVIWLTFLECLI